jgi:hypothetical protein
MTRMIQAMNPIGADVLGSVRQFWDAVAITLPGAEERFPRQLESAIPAALPLAIDLRFDLQ